MWSVDPARSSVEFAVRHMLVASLRGRFTDFEGMLEVTPDGTLTAHGTVNAASIDTNEPVRDERLRRSAEFFDVERFPQISYSSRDIARDDDNIAIAGDLTIRGFTRELQLQGRTHGPVPDATGSQRLALRLHGELDRSQFGITWNEALEKGGVLLADKVRINLAISARLVRMA